MPIKVRPAAMPNQPYAPGSLENNGPIFTAFSVERIGSMVYSSVYGAAQHVASEQPSFFARVPWKRLRNLGGLQILSIAVAG